MVQSSKDDRQDLAIKRWTKAKGRGILELPTGFGKTFTAIKTIKRLKAKKDNVKVIVVVPHKQLQQQWILGLSKQNVLMNCDVIVINSAIKTEKSCDLLICDEIHSFASEKNINVFRKIKHKYMMGLTGTLERADKRDKIITKYYPVVDRITVEEAITNKWISDYKQIRVLIDVDLSEYNEFNKEFNHHFAYFDYNFNLAMECLKDEQTRINLAQEMRVSPVEVMIHAMGFIRSMSARKSFIYDHPKKVEAANMIIESRLAKGRKIMTFTKTVDHASQVCCGPIYHSDLKKLEKDKILKAFNAQSSGVLNTAKALDVGSDVPGVNVGIVLSNDSSKTTKSQRSGRTLRFEEDKEAEIWQTVINDTMDVKWFDNANDNRKYITIRFEDLQDYLDGKEIKPVEQVQEFTLML